MMSPDEALRVAEQLQREGKFEQAEMILHQILAHNPRRYRLPSWQDYFSYPIGRTSDPK